MSQDDRLARGDPERGAVTVEAAFAVCSILVTAFLVLVAFGAAVAHLRSADAAVEAARLVARGDVQRASDAVARIAPSGAVLEVRVHGDEVVAEVRTQPLGPLLPEGWFRARGVAVLEPGVEIAEAVR